MSISIKNNPFKDQLIAFLKDGYLFASRQRRKAGLPADSHCPVTVNALGGKATIIRGEDAVDFFYDESIIKRDGAMPSFVQGPLFGEGAVHTLDGEAHKVRKAAMVAMAYEDERVDAFRVFVEEEMKALIERWKTNPGNIYDDVAVAYGRAAFRWAGVPASDEELNKRATQMSHLLDTFGEIKQNVLAWIDRKKLDTWAEQLIEDVRSGKVKVDADSVVQHMADLRDEKGELVAAKLAGIELQNLTRPTVAVSRFAAFAAVAMVQNPEWAAKVKAEVEENGGSLINLPIATAFAQETRRVYPFVPMLPGLVKKDAEVSGCPVAKGQRVLMDILGTHGSPKVWENPSEFNPQRFLDIEDYEQVKGFLPQGGGSVHDGHRCPGEKIAVAALSTTIAALSADNVTIAQESEDTTFSMTQLLTRPSTGVRVTVA
ncbi:MAG: cytochrome P450 [Rothia sp. (in: high G+C Gram-positive bacteria)]|nr:cytochrome P450 [Rothia sp. (in: high G+C Gram-positive bacteria)]